MSLSDAVRLLPTRIARDKAQPSDPFTPNEATAAAMREGRHGKLSSFDSIHALKCDLHAEDWSAPQRSNAANLGNAMPHIVMNASSLARTKDATSRVIAAPA